ncbi:small subunit ribosomal protein S8 [Breznakia sp. PF5-3]|uniref:30S ribosomal protein S8 n=1 Tax=unclassified Breznakia TaxID=2623764 RepID=UPI002406762D|nr:MULTISPECIES: 30S ribosomal protein S8 [unclassified Breznakia]MDL2276631.1 30S ribosomal protein S8 [Breznakia sp. OttesenSCG-928-G09]MDF9825157.1 small subunit ribosomal protein S8 [Breznakia sp. PM6-1]MDF9835984.1 small subunit ribosomal protein S8 [Breznakia sp. PF5-3]MDF9838082.1 small subunit ribosomal protein S8 [Breznakia sp. PFB2-8]MDF9860088.1 small subunit ribosomal protein S8 [Breznakia sp. PH5-24]
MIMTDPIADMLTRVRNAIQARHTTVDIPANKEKVEIAKILKEEGFITDFEVSGDVKKTITVTLKYGPNNEKVINGIKRISSPGLRVYTKADDMPRVLNGLGIAIISTSHGLLTDKDAKAKNVGGEVVAYVW